MSTSALHKPGIASRSMPTTALTPSSNSNSDIEDMQVYHDAADADTSFEIDDTPEDIDAEDEEDFVYIEHSMQETALVFAAAAAASKRSINHATPPIITTIAIKDCRSAGGRAKAIDGELDIGNDSDSPASSVLHSGSSTPTTADVAELSQTPQPNGVSAQLKASQPPSLQQNTPHYSLSPALTQYHYANNNNNNYSSYAASPQHLNNNNNGFDSSGGGGKPLSSLADDNLSASIATSVTTMTTTTEIDMDNIGGGGGGGAVDRQQQQQALTHHSNLVPRQCRQQQQLQSSPARLGGIIELTACRDDAIISVCSASVAGHKRTQSAASQASQKSQLPSVDSLQPKMQIWRWACHRFKSTGIGKPSVQHAMIVIFLEYFAWGLLTMPVIQNLKQIFPHHTFLMNGMLLGIKGLLSFLSAPLVGALSDIWGRKIFFLVTVFFTCSPIPLLTINLTWFFAMISISGIFAVTFSVVFAYVADVTTVEERSRAYGLVSATFAASLVISPALGNVLMNWYGDAFVVAIGIAIAILDIFFILVAVPESLPEKVRPSNWGAPINWEQADPFAALRKVGTNKTVMMQCVTVLLSNLPEAGQYSSIFVYLKWKIGFNTLEVSIFIAFVGILSISVQVTLGFFMRVFGAKSTIIIGLTFEMVQMLWFGLASEPWMMWGAGLLAALGSIAYPAISAFVSIHSNADSQGAVQGMLTGVRGLCNGLGPAVFGVIFYFFDVDLDDTTTIVDGDVVVQPDHSRLVPGPPFLFGAVMVVIAICVAVFIPETPNAEEPSSSFSRSSSSEKKHVQYEIESGRKLSTTMLDARAPLMRSDSMAQL